MDQNRKYLWHIIIKTLNIQSKERVLEAAKVSNKEHAKANPIRITCEFSLETLKAIDRCSSNY